jgi:hypothetical protein
MNTLTIPGLSATGSKHDVLAEYDSEAGTVRLCIIGANGKRHAAATISVSAAAELAMFLDTGRE